MTSLQADVDNILEMRGTEPETAPFELAKDNVLLFKSLTKKPPESLVVLRGTILAVLVRVRMLIFLGK